MYNFKTKKNHLAKAITLASLFVVSSAQAVMINKFVFCPNGTSLSEVTQYEYIYEPTVVWRSLSGGSAPRVSRSISLGLGSWYSMLPTIGRNSPVGHDGEFRYTMIAILKPGFLNMSGYDDKSIRIRDIVPTGDILDNGGWNYFPECQVDVTYI